jgi:hypothetical protein
MTNSFATRLLSVPAVSSTTLRVTGSALSSAGSQSAAGSPRDPRLLTRDHTTQRLSLDLCGCINSYLYAYHLGSCLNCKTQTHICISDRLLYKLQHPRQNHCVIVSADRSHILSLIPSHTLSHIISLIPSHTLSHILPASGSLSFLQGTLGMLSPSINTS